MENMVGGLWSLFYSILRPKFLLGVSFGPPFSTYILRSHSLTIIDMSPTFFVVVMQHVMAIITLKKLTVIV